MMEASMSLYNVLLGIIIVLGYIFFLASLRF
jgi:hypothetical protein